MRDLLFTVLFLTTGFVTTNPDSFIDTRLASTGFAIKENLGFLPQKRSSGNGFSVTTAKTGSSALKEMPRLFPNNALISSENKSSEKPQDLAPQFRPGDLQVIPSGVATKGPDSINPNISPSKTSNQQAIPSENMNPNVNRQAFAQDAPVVAENASPRQPKQGSKASLAEQVSDFSEDLLEDFGFKRQKNTANNPEMDEPLSSLDIQSLLAGINEAVEDNLEDVLESSPKNNTVAPASAVPAAKTQTPPPAAPRNSVDASVGATPATNIPTVSKNNLDDRSANGETVNNTVSAEDKREKVIKNIVKNRYNDYLRKKSGAPVSELDPKAPALAARDHAETDPEALKIAKEILKVLIDQEESLSAGSNSPLKPALKPEDSGQEKTQKESVRFADASASTPTATNASPVASSAASAATPPPAPTAVPAINLPKAPPVPDANTPIPPKGERGSLFAQIQQGKKLNKTGVTDEGREQNRKNNSQLGLVRTFSNTKLLERATKDQTSTPKLKDVKKDPAFIGFAEAFEKAIKGFAQDEGKTISDEIIQNIITAVVNNPDNFYKLKKDNYVDGEWNYEFAGYDGLVAFAPRFEASTDTFKAEFLKAKITDEENKTQARVSRDQEDDRVTPQTTPKSVVDNANRAFTRDQLSDEEATQRSGLFASISGFTPKSKKSSEDIDEELNRERSMKQSSPLPNANAGNQNFADGNENLEDDLKKGLAGRRAALIGESDDDDW